MQSYEMIDLRIWDTFYSQWRPITPVEEGSVSRRGDFGVDTMSLTLPAPHPLDSLLLASRVIGPPVSFELNGVQWTGRLSEVKKIRQDGAERWVLTAASDDKHLHRLQAKTPVTAADGGHTVRKGKLAEVAEWMIARGVARTGLPVYFCADVEGPEVEITARTEDTIADVLTKPAERQNLFVDVRALTPDNVATRGLPGTAVIKQFMGELERRWFKKFTAEGAYPHAVPQGRIQAAPTGFDDVVTPPGWFVGNPGVGQLGQARALAEGQTLVCWNPFEINPGSAPSDLYYRDGSERQRVGVTRGATADELAQLASSTARQWFGVFVTHWAAGQWLKHLDTGLLGECAAAGMLVRADGREVRTPQDVQNLDGYIGAGAAWAWQQGGQWVIANRTDWTRESTARQVTGPQPPYPGLLVHFFPERDRRQVVFTTAPGGGLEGWEAAITPPDAASLIAGAQWDKWMGALMAGGGLSDRATGGVQISQSAAEVTGASSALPTAGEAVAKSGGAVQRVTAQITPGATTGDSDVSFSTLTAGMDMAIVGPLFYREKYFGIGSGDWSADVATSFEEEWAKMQGSTSMQMTVGSGRNVIFGDDAARPDGTKILGWRVGDRISLIDGETHLTEVISGWECKWSAANPAPVVVPLLGKRSENHTPVDTLVDTVRKIQKATERAQVSPPKVPTQTDVTRVVERWSSPLRAEMKDSLQESAEAIELAQEATAVARQSTLDSEEAQNQAIRALTTAQEATQNASIATNTAVQALQKSQAADEEFKRQQAQINDQQRQINDQQLRLNSMVARPLGAAAGYSDADEYGELVVSSTNVTFASRKRWYGKVYLTVNFEALNNYSKVYVEPIDSARPAFSMSSQAFQGVRDVFCTYKVFGEY